MITQLALQDDSKFQQIMMEMGEGCRYERTGIMEISTPLANEAPGYPVPLAKENSAHSALLEGEF
jgi:hypothetical protein